MLLGFAIGLIDFMIAVSQLPPGARGTPEEDRLVLDACITTYGVAYPTGELLYWLFGAREESSHLRSWSRWHLALLHTVGAGWLLYSNVNGMHQGFVLRPSLVVALLMLGEVGLSLWRKARAAIRRSEERSS
jgi:hypothetical protein